MATVQDLSVPSTPAARLVSTTRGERRLARTTGWLSARPKIDSKTCSGLLLNTTRFESQPVVKRSGLWLRHGVERLAEQAFAQEKLAHRLHPLAEGGVARHQYAVGIFTARVELEQQ